MADTRVQICRADVSCTRENHYAQPLVITLVTHSAVGSFPQLLWINIVSAHARSHAHADLRTEPSP